MAEDPCPHGEIVEQMRLDMYHGDWRKPGVTTRLESLEERMTNVERTQAGVGRKLSRIQWLLITTLVAVILELALKH